MAKNKLKRFAELETFERVFQPGNLYVDTTHELHGNWNRDVFHNANPIIAELGCGRGEYTINMARALPGKNFIGIDKKGARLWRGARTSNEENILNAAFLRVRIEQLDSFFDKGELSEIWITFPDPQPQSTRENTRMTSPRFLEMYRRILVTNGTVHLKTDNAELFGYTLEKVKSMGLQVHLATGDLYSLPVDEILAIKTTYESRFLKQGFKICYLRFSY